MPNVYFKRGTQSELNRIQKGNYEPGAFYLTSDTNRLYFAQANDDLAELNQFIHIYDGAELPVSTTAEPLTEGDFYYWQSKNILMVYKNGNWIQINPDTRLAASQQAVTVAGATNGATITTTVSEDASKGVNTARSVVGDFTIAGGDNVTVSVSGNTITIQSENDTTNTEYELKTTANANNAQLVLSEKGNNPETDTITMVGDNGLKVSSNANNQITISPVAELIKGVANEFDSNGNLTTTVTYGNNLEKTSSSIVPTVKYGIANDKLETAVFKQNATGNPTATLNIYTKQEIDDKLEQEKELLNAMTFKGTISASTSVSLMNSSDRSVGDVFLVSDKFSYGSPSETVYAGDLIVAEGTDDNIHWTRIQSGNDQIVTVNSNAAGKSVTFRDTVSSNAIGSIAIDNNNISNNGAGQVSISATVSGTNNENIEYNITHLAPDANKISAQVFNEPNNANGEIQSAVTPGTNSTLDIPTIKSIKIDNLGHIASIETAKFRVIDSWPTLSKTNSSATVTNNIGYYSFGLGYQGHSSTQQTWSLGLTSDNLTVTAQDGDQLKVNLEWGSFT